MFAMLQKSNPGATTRAGTVGLAGRIIRDLLPVRSDRDSDFARTTHSPARSCSVRPPKKAGFISHTYERTLIEPSSELRALESIQIFPCKARPRNRETE